jgi:hypothetical protein
MKTRLAGWLNWYSTCKPVWHPELKWQYCQKQRNKHKNNPRDSPMSLAPVAHACKTRYLVDWDQEDGSQGQYRKIVFETTVTKITRGKWRYGSSCWAYLLQVQSSEFKPQSPKQKQTKKETRKIKVNPGENWLGQTPCLCSPNSLLHLFSPLFLLEDICITYLWDMKPHNYN